MQVEQELRVKATPRNPPKKPCDLDVLSGTVKVTKHEAENLKQGSKSKKLGTHARSFNDIRASDRTIHRKHKERTALGDSVPSLDDKSCRPHDMEYPTSSGAELERKADVRS